MILILALGNPGRKYSQTRHNIGWLALDAFAKHQKLARWRFDPKTNSQVIVKDNLVLAKPQTFMNASGFAVQKLISQYLERDQNFLSRKKQYENLYLIHDDVDLPIGKLKIVKAKGSAGHRGVLSVINEIGTVDFVRFRLGIGRPHSGRAQEGGKRASKLDTFREVSDFVLEEFLPTEKDEVKHLIVHVVSALKLAIEKGIEAAMNQYN